MHRIGCVIGEHIKTNSFHTFFFLTTTSIKLTLAFFRKFHFWSGIFWVQMISNMCTGNMNTKSTVLPCHNLFAYPNFEHYSFTVLAHCEYDRFTIEFEYKLNFFYNGVHWHSDELKFIKIFAEPENSNNMHRVQNKSNWIRRKKIHYHRKIRKWFADFDVILYIGDDCNTRSVRSIIIEPFWWTISQLKIKWASEKNIFFASFE